MILNIFALILLISAISANLVEQKCVGYPCVRFCCTDCKIDFSISELPGAEKFTSYVPQHGRPCKAMYALEPEDYPADVYSILAVVIEWLLWLWPNMLIFFNCYLCRMDLCIRSITRFPQSSTAFRETIRQTKCRSYYATLKTLNWFKRRSYIQHVSNNQRIIYESFLNLFNCSGSCWVTIFVNHCGCLRMHWGVEEH